MSVITPKTGRRTRRRRAGERGQSLVEFVLTAPILILMLIGLVEIGDGLNSYLTVVSAARDGARLSSQGNATDSAVVAMVAKETERIKSGGGIDNATCNSNDEGVCVTKSGTPPSGSASVTVRVCFDHPLLLGLPILLPDEIKMCSTTVMRRLK